MGDSSRLTLLHSAFVPKEEHARQDSRHGNDEKQQKRVCRMKANEGQKHRTDCARCPETSVSRMVSVLLQCRPRPSCNSRNIQGRKPQPSETMKVASHRLTKLVQHEHVERQMHPVCMYEGVRQDAMPFAMVLDGMRRKHQGFFVPAMHPVPGNQHRNQNHQGNDIHRVTNCDRPQ